MLVHQSYITKLSRSRLQGWLITFWWIYLTDDEFVEFIFWHFVTSLVWKVIQKLEFRLNWKLEIFINCSIYVQFSFAKFWSKHFCYFTYIENSHWLILHCLFNNQINLNIWAKRLFQFYETTTNNPAHWLSVSSTSMP